MADRRVALITGGARRLGRAIALHLAASGWDVCIHYMASQLDALQTQADAESLGGHAPILQGDLADEGTCRQLLTSAIDACGRVDAVVNNASLFEYDDAASITHASMERHWRSNTFPAIVLAQALHTHVQPRGVVGCVVNLLDQKLWNPNPDYLSYTLSKAALEAATTLLAQSLAPHVRVVGVAPGVTLASGPMSGSQFQEAAAMTPMGRSSTPDDIARAVAYLLDASAVTGTTLLVDGGQHMAHQARDVMFLGSAGKAS
jgi:NAD(P)-dependent dehydrogenase (short-subunit alcohol dehydrogenase family)